MSLIFSSFFRALGQMGSGAFLKVIFLGAALALALLAAVTWGFSQVIFAFAPDTVNLPFFGGVDGLAIRGGLDGAVLGGHPVQS
jgi:hypothetical protein